MEQPKGDLNPATRIHKPLSSKNHGGLNISTVKYCLKSIDLNHNQRYIDLINCATTDITPTNEPNDFDTTFNVLNTMRPYESSPWKSIRSLYNYQASFSPHAKYSKCIKRNCHQSFLPLPTKFEDKRPPILQSIQRKLSRCKTQPILICSKAQRLTPKIPCKFKQRKISNLKSIETKSISSVESFHMAISTNNMTQLVKESTESPTFLNDEDSKLIDVDNQIKESLKLIRELKSKSNSAEIENLQLRELLCQIVKAKY